MHSFSDNGISKEIVWAETTNDEEFLMACSMDSKITIWGLQTH